MELYIGGYGENKLEYVKACLKSRKDGKNNPPAFEIADIKNFNQPDFFNSRQDKILVIDGLHLIIKELLEKGLNQEEILKKISSLEALYSDIYFICDEIGNGIVPLEKSDRIWREVTGRILCSLAARCKKVRRIVCGLAQVIKG